MSLLGTRWLAPPLVLLLCAACGGEQEPPEQTPPIMHMPDVDADGDGLDDAWESAVGRLDLLDPARQDTDDDGVLDGDEDLDGDGLTNLEEFLLGFLNTSDRRGPDPMTRTLLIELDSVTGRAPTDEVIDDAVEAYTALGGSIDLQVFRDQEDLDAFDFDGTFSQRHRFLRESGPVFAGKKDPRIPFDRMAHVVFATRRTDISGRGGEIITAGDNPEETGVIVYVDVLEEIHPQCGRAGMPPITAAEALAATLTHEVGHLLQLGHDTGIGGGINYFNIMSVPTSCEEAQMRFHGVGNDDMRLGNTAAISAPRFSNAAEALIDLDDIVSVDTAVLVNDNGRDM